MRFVVDANLPRRLTDWLIERGHQCEHVLDLDLAQSSDEEIWRYCLSSGAIIVSKDEDFANRVRGGRRGPVVVWVRTGNGTTRELIQGLAPIFGTIEARLMMGERLVEVR